MKNNSCPNPNDPKWKELVKKFGEAMAQAAFAQNNNVVPSIEDAERIMSNFKLKEKDEQLSASSDGFKLKRAAMQRAMLERVQLKPKTTPVQKQAIQKLIDMNEKYQEFLRDNIEKAKLGAIPEETVSVTKFSGQSSFKGDASVYESYKLFGTFMHEILELAQEDAIVKGKTVTDIFNREYFDKAYKNYIEKNPFDIIDLTEDEMFMMAEDIISKVYSSVNTNMIILPEITVVGQSSDGSKVIGRLDLLGITPSGKMQIIDFKTKKVSNMIWETKHDMGGGEMYTERKVDLESVFAKLGDNPTFEQEIRPGTNQDIANLPRNTFDTWRVQLELYDRMLQQNGLEVDKKSIVSLLYDVDRETGKYKGKVVHTFENQDYYEQTISMVQFEGNKKAFWNNIDSYIRQFEEALSKAMPIPGEAARQERLKKNPEEAYSFRPSQENMNRFVDHLEAIVEDQLQKVNEQLSKLKKGDEALERLYKERKGSLSAFLNIIKSVRTKAHSDKEAVRNAANFNTALETMEAEVKVFHEISNEAFLSFEEIMNKADKDKSAIRKLKSETKQIFEAYKKSQTLSQIIKAMRELMVEIIADETNDITADNPANAKLSEVETALVGIEANMRKAAKMAWMEILKTPGEEVFKSVERDLKMAIEPKIIKLQKDLKTLKEDSGLGVLKTLKDSFFSMINSDYKKRIEESLGPDGKRTLSEVEKIEREITRYQEILADFDGSDRSLEKYIDGILDPKVSNYLGSQSVWNPDSLLSGYMHFDQYIASASNSDLGIATFTLMMKNQEAQARDNIVNDEKMSTFDQIRRELLDKGYNLEQINDAISEWREVVYREKGSTEISKKNKLFIAKPFSEEYETTYRSFDHNIRILNKEIYELKADFHEKFGVADKVTVEQARQAWKDKVQERDNANAEFIEWLRANSNLPYTDAFYELQLGLPPEIRTKLQDIYLEREILVRHVGVGNEILLNEEDWDRLIELDIEQNKLFQEASEKSEEYARRVEKFNELYEYDTNDRFFRAVDRNKKIQYADDPESYEKWRSLNTVTRPTSEWYEDLNELHEQMSVISGNDMVLSELRERKVKIMRPHKHAGRFNPKFLNDEEIKALDEIEGLIEERYEELRNSPSGLSKEQRKQLAQISNEIKAIKTKQLNEKYVQEYDSRLRILENRMKEMKSADNALTLAKAKGDKKEIDTAENELIAATVQFQQKEQEFEAWFNKNHVNKYQSIVDFGIPKKQPKSFNYENLPNPAVKDQYMETVPNPKYYKLKRLKLGNWTLDGVELKNEEIKELQKNPEQIEQLKNDLDSQGNPRLVTRPGAYNENFIKGPDGIPLPKEIMLNNEGHYVPNPAVGTTKNINPKYLDILNSPDMSRLYNALTDMYFGLQEKVEGRKTGYGVPGIASSMVENIARDGFMKAFKRQTDIFFDKHLRTTESQHDKVENVFGDLGQSMRLRFADQLPEGMQTEDVLGAVMQWTTEAHMNIAMQEVAPISEMGVEFLKMQRDALIDKGDEVRQKEMDTVIDMLEAESKKFLSGSLSDQNARKLQKIAGAVFGWSAFVRIGFDLANQTKNYVAGNVQAFLAAGANQNDHYSREDFLKAKKLVYGYNGFIHNYFSDWGKVSDLHESTMLYRMYNPLQKDMLKYYNDIAGGKTRKTLERAAAPGEMGFLLQDKGDTEIGVTVMYSVMSSYKFPEIESIDPQTGEKTYKKDSDGNVVYVPVHEAYAKNKKGQLVRRTDVDFSKEDESRIRNIIYSEIRRAQGNYAESDRTRVERTLMGKAMFFFRKFLIPGMLNRFGYLRPNWEGSEASLGYWRAVWQSWKYFGPKAVLGEFFLGGKMMEKLGATGLDAMIVEGEDGQMVKKDVGDFYKRRVHHARRDAAAMMILGLLSFMLLSYVKRKDEDDEEIDMLTGNAIRVIWGVKMETMSMFPVGAGSEEYVKNFTTAIPLVREATSIIKMGNHAYSLGLAMLINGGEEPDPGYDSEYYEKVWKDAFYSRSSGPYEKGDIKLVKDFADLTGIKNFRDIFNPSNKIDNLKRLQ
jgi:hypothetical protein